MAAKKTSRKARQSAKKETKKGTAEPKAVAGRRSTGAVVALAADERPPAGSAQGGARRGVLMSKSRSTWPRLPESRW